MNTFKISDKNFSEKIKIWSSADDGNFQAIIDTLLEAGIAEDSMGEALFNFADQAIEEKRFNTAINILIFLVQALEDQSEAPPLLKKIGDIYILLTDYEKAREYYGRLPLTLENIKLCLATFIHTLDIDGLLSLRDTVLTRISKTNHTEIHAYTDEIILKIYTDPKILNAHVHLFKKNIEYLKTIYPFFQNDNKYNNLFAFDPYQISQTDIIKISDRFYIKQDNIWSKSFSLNHIQKKKIEQHGSDIMLHCNSLESFSIFIDLIKTSNPEFIKKECRVIIDFKLLKQALKVINLYSLLHCDFVIRFIDKNCFRSQLTHLLLERKLPFAERVIYLSKEDPEFFSKHVNPVLIDCEKKILYKIDQYEQLYPKLFPDDYQDKVIQKIKTGQKLNILLCTSRYTTYLQYSTRDIATGFQQLRHNTFIQIEDEDSGMGIRKDVSIENLINFKPDIIFAINHLRCSTFPWFPKSIPFVTWIQDLMPHILNLNDPTLITKHDHVFSFSQNWIDNIFSAHIGFKHKKMHCLPISVDSNIYYPIPECKKKYDIIFITHLFHPNETFLPLLKGETLSEIKSDHDLIFLNQLINELNKVSFTYLYQIQNVMAVREKFVKKICIDLEIPFTNSIKKNTASNDENNAFSRLTKHIFLLLKTKPIESLLKHDFDVRVFGKNWDKLPQFEDIAMGSINNGTELNRIINESRINLNMSPGTSYHMKAPEVIATGSFMLTRRIPKANDYMPITNFFKEKREIVLFDDELDLIKKAAFFLKNKEKRQAIAKAAYHNFHKKYSIENTANSILQTISSS